MVHNCEWTGITIAIGWRITKFRILFNCKLLISFHHWIGLHVLLCRWQPPKTDNQINIKLKLHRTKKYDDSYFIDIIIFDMPSKWNGIVFGLANAQSVNVFTFTAYNKNNNNNSLCIENGVEYLCYFRADKVRHLLCLRWIDSGVKIRFINNNLWF